MSTSDKMLFPDGSMPDNPRVREEMAARMRAFHQEMVAKIGRPEMLKVYCHALSNWVLNPNTDPYQIEMLFDEICLGAQQEGLDDWDA
jgi:hypothetical protein